VKKKSFFTLFLVSYFFLLSFCENFINNQRLLKRFPNWDFFWHDSMTYSQINQSQKSIGLLNFSQINLHSGFGIPSIQEKMFFNPFNAFNLLLKLPISPSEYAFTRTIFFLAIMGLGTYFLLSAYTRNKPLTLFLASFSTALPLFWGMLYNWLGLYSLTCSIPMLLHLIFRNRRKPKWSNLLFLFLLLDLVGFDLLSTCAFFLVLISLVVTDLYFGSRTKQIIHEGSSLIICFGATLTFLIPFGSFLIQNFYYLQKLQVHSVNHITLYGYIKLFISNGAFSIFYPYEGSGVLLYLPAFFGVILIFTAIQNYKKLLKRSDTSFSVGPKYYVFFSLVLGILPLTLYAFPFLTKFAPSYYRFQLNICSVLIFLASSIVIIKIDLKKQRVFKIVAASLIIEGFLFFLPPWLLLAKFIPKLRLASEVFVIHGKLYSHALLRTIRYPEIFFQNFPWFNLILGNFVVFCLIIFLKRLNKSVTPFVLIVTAVLSLVTTTTYFANELDLKRFESGAQQAVSDDYRLKNYETRTSLWIRKYHINDQNFRVIPAGLDSYYPGSGRNAKLIGDTELNNSLQINTVIQYREVDNPAAQLKYFHLECNQNCDSAKGQFEQAYHPPTVAQVASNTSWLKSNGVKFVIVADARIKSSAFKLLDTYIYPAKFGYDPTESGFVSLYELRHSNPIATSITYSDDIKIPQIGRNEIFLKASRSDLQDVEIRYLFSKNYRAYQGNKEITISELPDGFMELHDIEGNELVLLRYGDHSYLWGMILWVCFMLLGLLMQWRTKRRLEILKSDHAELG